MLGVELFLQFDSVFLQKCDADDTFGLLMGAQALLELYLLFFFIRFVLITLTSSDDI